MACLNYADITIRHHFFQPLRELNNPEWTAALVALTALVKHKPNYKDAEELRKQAFRGSLNLVRIPAGEFVYDVGNQRIRLPEFAISYSAITFDQFQAFVKATGYSAAPGGAGSGPVNTVSWDDAQAFCAWAGVALPTEQQWVRAALALDEQGQRRLDVGRIYWEWCANAHESGGKALRHWEADGSGVGGVSRDGSYQGYRLDNLGFRVVAP